MLASSAIDMVSMLASSAIDRVSMLASSAIDRLDQHTLLDFIVQAH
jgi:uncharacterized protein YutE (UPF0331/DUF86 family)